MGTKSKEVKLSQTPNQTFSTNNKGGSGSLIFVVQKHRAKNLHYDFRLEVNGELVSWALPKGPSMNPQKKHLAIRVKNHPFDYKDFEGVIQESEYGAGEVIVWDKGTYEWTETPGKKATIRSLIKGLKDGKINILLNGTKMRGEFHLIRMKDDEWLLIKSQDEFASKKDITQLEESVISGKKIEDFAVKNKSIKNRNNEMAISDPAQKRIGNALKKSSIIVSHPDKIYWPKLYLTKQALLNYYCEISDFILPFIRNRLHSLHRYPDGIQGQSFYQKNLDPKNLPAGLKTHIIKRAKDDKEVHYLLCENQEALLYMINLGCIEINPWNNTLDSPNKPDWMVLDLDPEGVSFKEVIKTAIELKRFFDEVEITSYIKTSGLTGMHIYVPAAKKYTYTEVRSFAKKIATLVHQRNPETTSILRSPAKRRQRVYLDYLQNSPGQTVVAPFSVRPNEQATVSMPLHWDELNLRLNPGKFTMLNTIKRAEKSFEFWKGVLGKGVNLEKCLSKY
jgi:bifunctional non-homologous end joining protein LigD